MSEVDLVLQKLASGDNVPMVPLGEIATLVRGSGLQKKDFQVMALDAFITDRSIPIMVCLLGTYFFCATVVGNQA